ncbi:MAG: tail assembly protein [Candidatus Lokiarchaeota archaeon]|nr:tail assembly protein [Candidatus Lokiarchaeota archaeon]
MTKVVLHGVLAEQFGKDFKFKVSSVKEVLHAIEANRPGFFAKINKLAKQGMHYTFLVDNKRLTKRQLLKNKKAAKSIEVVPVIIGSGPIAAAVGTAIATAALSAALAAGTITFTTFVLASLAVSLIGLYLQFLLAPKPPEPPAIEATTRALEQSFTFSNKANLASQGLPIPVGYGRLLVGTNVIEYTSKNLPVNRRFNLFQPDDGVPGQISQSEEPIVDTVIWPSEPPIDYRVWLKAADVEAETVFYYDPDTSHDCFPSGFHTTNHCGINGSIPFSVKNEGSGDVYISSIRLFNKPTFGYNAIRTGFSDQYDYGSFIGPGVNLETHIKNGILTDAWGISWGTTTIRDQTARIPTKGYWGPAGFQNYGATAGRFSGSNYWLIYVYPRFTTPNPYTKENIITEILVRAKGTIEVIYWDNQLLVPPESLFKCPIYPNETISGLEQCNGFLCATNSTTVNPTSTCSNSQCPPNGPGLQIRQSTSGGGIGDQFVDI